MKKKLANLLLTLIACLFAVFGLVACGENPLSVSAPQNVRIDAGTMAVVWDKVENAEKYTISINDGTEYTISGNSYACSQYVSGMQTFTVKVSAVSSVGDMTSDPTIVTFSPLAQVTDLALSEEGVLTWSSVPSATAYALSIDGKEQELPLTVPEYTISETGRHTYKVRGIVPGSHNFYSVWSKEQTVIKLATVDASKIKYNVEDGKLSWPSVSNAFSYEVVVNGTVIAEDCQSTSIDFDCPNADFIVTVQAKSKNENTLKGEISEGKEFIFLDPVTNIKVVDGVLVWDEVENASKYIVKVGDKKKTVATTSYNQLTRGVSHTVSIMPTSENASYFSSWSAPQSFFLLEAPTIQWNSSLALDDGEAKNNVYWDAVANAAGYTLHVTKPDGTDFVEGAGATDRTFAYAFLEVGTYKVELKATADPDDASFCDSPYSAPITVTRLASPKALSSNFITSNPKELSKGFTVSFEKVSGASGYRLYKEDVHHLDIASTASQFKVTDVVDQNKADDFDYDYTIQTLGAGVMQNNKVVLSSLKDKLLAFTITVLPTPQSPTIEAFTYSYGSITGANGYSVSTGSGLHDSNATTFDLGKVLTAGNWEVRVCAKGNGGNILASNYSEPIKVYRLEKPYNIRIQENGDGGIVQCSGNDGRDSYRVVIDNVEHAAGVNLSANVLKDFKASGTSVYMEALANSFGVDGTYYMTSQPSDTATFMKLQAPTFGTEPFTNTQLRWNNPANMNTNVYTPTYEVYDGSNQRYEGDMRGNTMNIEYLEGGKEYRFKVKAIGNGTQYISSELSDEVKIYKLASPEITRDLTKNAYMWNAVSDASGYVLYIGDDIVGRFAQESGKTYEYVPSFKDIGTYTVTVLAIGDTSKTIDSPKVAGVNQIEQRTMQLERPDFALSYSHPTVDDAGELTVQITRESPNARGYYYSIGSTGGSTGAEVLGKTSYTKDLANPGEYRVAVYAIGGAFDEEGVYYVDSESQGGTDVDKYKLTLLDTPRNMSWSKGKVFTWDANTAPYGYTIEISVDGGEYEQVETGLKAERLDFTSAKYKAFIEVATKVRFRVRADGYGTNVITSKTAESQVWDIS